MALAPQNTDYAVALQPGSERRMNIRAFEYWESLLEGRDFPSVGDLDPDQIAPFRDFSLLIDFTAGYEAPILRYVGTHLRAEASLANRDMDPNEVPPGTLLSRLTSHYLEILANRAPIGFEAEFDTSEGEHILYRGILLPLSDDGTTINFIYGVINWHIDDGATLDADVLDLDAPVDPDDAELLELTNALDSAGAEMPGSDVPDSDDAEEDPVDLELQSLVSEIDAAMGLEAPAEDAPLEQDDAPDEAFEGAAPAEAMPQEAADIADIADVDQPLAEPAEAAAVAEATEGLDPDAEELLDLLSVCQTKAADLARFDSRTRQALYDTLALAYDFHVVSQRKVSAYQELLDQTGIKTQERAPLTPIIKLVFGGNYDKTRVTEYASALAYADRESVQKGQFLSFVETFEGGLKGMVMAERAAKSAGNGNAAMDRLESAKQLLRSAEPVLKIAAEDVPATVAQDDEFVMMIARREASGGLAVLDTVKTGKSALESALKKVAETKKKA